jgi:hypothetical protein
MFDIPQLLEAPPGHVVFIHSSFPPMDVVRVKDPVTLDGVSAKVVPHIAPPYPIGFVTFQTLTSAIALLIPPETPKTMTFWAQ